jgi:peroxiredoxin 2/4
MSLEPVARAFLIGEKAPSFIAESTRGVIFFPNDFKGKWVIFFSHPANFTPVCIREFMSFASKQPDFEKANCKLLGLSIDSAYNHSAWLRTIKDELEFAGMKDIEVTFPVISDLTMEVSKAFGILRPVPNTLQAVRAVFIIDPQAVVRTIIYYPLANDHDMEEVECGKQMICPVIVADETLGITVWARVKTHREKRRTDEEMLGLGGTASDAGIRSSTSDN